MVAVRICRTQVHEWCCVSAGKRDWSQLEDRAGIPGEALREPAVFQHGDVLAALLANASTHVLPFASPDG